MTCGSFEGQGIERSACHNGYPEGRGQALGRGDADPDTRVEAGTDVHNDGVEIVREPPGLIEAKVDRRHQKSGVTGPVKAGRGGDDSAILGQNHS
jgi:hypothetical protein